jgi:hypothetical protein
MKNYGLLNAANHKDASGINPDELAFIKERINSMLVEKLSNEDLILRCAYLELIAMHGKLKASENMIGLLLSEQKHDSFINKLPDTLHSITNRINDKASKRIPKSGGDGKAKKSLEPKRLIKEAWASGEYINRSVCSLLKWKDFGFKKESTARTALKRELDPDPWPAKLKPL